jgi:general secretion pathway protein D
MCGMKVTLLGLLGLVCVAVVQAQPTGVMRPQQPRPSEAVEATASRPAPTRPLPSSPAVDAAQQGDLMARLNFSEAPLDIVLADFSEKTGRTLLRAPGLPTPTFTLRSQGELTIAEYLRAVETVLTMHGIGLVEYGEKFTRVVPIASIRRESMDIFEPIPEGVVLDRSGTMISQMVALKHIDIKEATTAIEPMRNERGQIHAFERTNSIMITDFASNINRMLQVLRMLDNPIEAREEPNIIQIRFAKASEIKQRLEEIISESQREQQQASAPRQRTSGRPGVESTPVPSGPPGVIRPPSVRQREAQEAAPAGGAADPMLVAEAQRGIIRGKVQIIADERTNLLIIITRPENMAFFERIVAVLDVETSPDVIVEVVRLEFANAEEIAGMLNNLIGATSRERPAGSSVVDSEGSESRRLAEIEAALQRREREAEASRRSSVGELSKDNVTILSDKRTNSLILMARRGDIETIKDIIRDMDRMLAQVLIEAVILDVSLDDSFETGVSWVQNALTTYTVNSRGERSPIMSFAGGGGGASGGLTPRDATTITDPASLSTSGLGYFFTLFDLNVSAVLRASATDSRSRVVSTPALLTTDNTEATLSSTERIYVFEGTTFVGTATDSRTARYRQEDVGLTLTVKPQINENHVVMMQIKQEISEPGDITNPDTDNLAGQRISLNRKLEASIAVRSGQTIVLGGQVRERDSRNRTKIPILGDIPILGRLFNSDTRGTGRTETIVFITPYVLDTPDKVAQETRRRRDSLNIDGMWPHGWSGSELADPPGYQRPLPGGRPAAIDSRQSPQRSVAPREGAVSSPSPSSHAMRDDEVASFIEERMRRAREAFEQALPPVQ